MTPTERDVLDKRIAQIDFEMRTIQTRHDNHTEIMLRWAALLEESLHLQSLLEAGRQPNDGQR